MNVRIFLKVAVIVCLGFLASQAFFISSAHALPPRPENSGPPSSGGGGGDHGSDGTGGGLAFGSYIELQVNPPQPEAWAGVQWRDASETWFDVDGWQGDLDDAGQQSWWVGAANLGQGPFRWIVYQDSTRTVVLGSSEFYLPRTIGEVLKVEVSLQDPLPPTATQQPTVTQRMISLTPAPTPTQVLSSTETVSSTQQVVSTVQVPTPTVEATPSPTYTRVPSTPSLTAQPVAILQPADPTPPAENEVLALHQTASVTEVEPGGLVTWHLDILNSTKATAKNVVIRDIFPGDLIYESTSINRGQVTGSPNVVVIQLEELKPGEKIQVEVTTRVATGVEDGSVLASIATSSSPGFKEGTSNSSAVTVRQKVVEEVTMTLDPIESDWVSWLRHNSKTIVISFGGLVLVVAVGCFEFIARRNRKSQTTNPVVRSETNVSNQ